VLSDRCNHIIDRQAQPLGLDYQLFQFLMQQVAAASSSRARRLRHHCANARMNLKYAFRHQLRHHLMSCIGIDLQSLAKFSYGGKRVTNAHLP
jgi:hypothetical protein